MNSKIAILISFLLLSTLTVSAQYRGYNKGYIIIEGERIQEGLIKYSIGTWSLVRSSPAEIKFKINRKSKPFKAKDDVTGFVIESDSFTVHKNIDVNSMAALFEKDFVRVVEVGKINLFLHQCFTPSGSGLETGSASYYGGGYINDTWILKKGLRQLVIKNIKRQKESLIRLISDNKALAAEIESKKPREIGIRHLIRRYNADRP